MLQLNDEDHTLIDLSKKNLRHIKLNNHYYIKIIYDLDEAEIETMFTYESVAKARDDYQMLIDMVKDGPTLLQEEEMEMYESYNLKRWNEYKT